MKELFHIYKELVKTCFILACVLLGFSVKAQDWDYTGIVSGTYAYGVAAQNGVVTWTDSVLNLPVAAQFAFNGETLTSWSVEYGGTVLQGQNLPGDGQNFGLAGGGLQLTPLGVNLSIISPDQLSLAANGAASLYSAGYLGFSAQAPYGAFYRESLTGTGTQIDPPTSAPELSSSVATAALTLLLGLVAILKART